jgi:hypothetical protein
MVTVGNSRFLSHLIVNGRLGRELIKASPEPLREVSALPPKADMRRARTKSPLCARSRRAQATNVVPSDQRFRPRDGASLSGVTPSNFGVTSAIILRTSSPRATRA